MADGGPGGPNGFSVSWFQPVPTERQGKRFSLRLSGCGCAQRGPDGSYQPETAGLDGLGPGRDHWQSPSPPAAVPSCAFAQLAASRPGPLRAAGRQIGAPGQREPGWGPQWRGRAGTEGTSLHSRFLIQTTSSTGGGSVRRTVYTEGPRDVLLCAASPQTWLRKQSSAGEFRVHNSGIVSSAATETVSYNGENSATWRVNWPPLPSIHMTVAFLPRMALKRRA